MLQAFLTLKPNPLKTFNSHGVMPPSYYVKQARSSSAVERIALTDLVNKHMHVVLLYFAQFISVLYFLYIVCVVCLLLFGVP